MGGAFWQQEQSIQSSETGTAGRTGREESNAKYRGWLGLDHLNPCHSWKGLLGVCSLLQWEITRHQLMGLCQRSQSH